MIDVVTLENYAETLPTWSPDDASHLHALVDMGSNGIRFSISDLSPPRTRLLPCIYRERAPISLFDALTAVPDAPNGAMALPDETIRLVAATLARFRRIAVDDYGVRPDRMAVFATEAMRRSANADALLAAIAEKAPGLAVHVLAPEVETLFGSIGARAGFYGLGHDLQSGGLMLDLGGGSVQVTYVDPKLGAGYEVAAARAGQSMPYGAARLTRAAAEHDADTLSTPDTPSTLDTLSMARAAPRLADDMEAAIGRLHEQSSLGAVRAQNRDSSDESVGLDMYLCGGGFRGYGSMLMHSDAIQPYPVPLMGGYRVDGSVFANTQALLDMHHKLAGTKIFGMSKRRRAQFAAITAVVDALVTALRRTGHPRIRSVTFCQGGNREGALMMRLPAAVRESDPLKVLAAGCDAITAALVSALPVCETQAQDLVPFLPIVGKHIWDRLGVDAAANSAYVLHDAVVREPSTPGLTHQARAVLAISLWSRWGGGVAPADVNLLDGLRQLLGRGGHDDSVFWAEYVGGVAAVLAAIFSAPPTAEQLKSVRFVAGVSTSKRGKAVTDLGVQVTPELASGLSPEAITDCFDSVGKQYKDTRKIKVQLFVGTSGF